MAVMIHISVALLFDAVLLGLVIVLRIIGEDYSLV